MSEKLKRLTIRELDCLRLVEKGLTAKGIASDLGISSSTVEKHLSAVRKKLGAKRTAQALAALSENSVDKAPAETDYGCAGRSARCSLRANKAIEAILSSSSREDAWQCVQSYLGSDGYNHAIVGVVAEPFGQLTNGAHVVDSSFGDDVMEIYDIAGGANADPVARRIAGTISSSSRPFFCSSTEIIQQHIANVPTAVGKMMARFLEMDLQHLFVVPNKDISTGAPYSLTVHIDSRLAREFTDGKKPNLRDLRSVAETYWSFLKSKKHLARMSGLSVRQKEVLCFAARGFRVEEAAEHMHVSRRSAEKHLQGAREALGAPTTAAAVFRANVLGVF